MLQLDRIQYGNSCILPDSYKYKRSRPGRASSSITEITILTIASRAAVLTTGALLACVPAQARPSSSSLDAAAARPRAGLQHKHECRRLRAAILESEQADRRVRAAVMESVQPDLFILRERYRKLGCQGGART